MSATPWTKRGRDEAGGGGSPRSADRGAAPEMTNREEPTQRDARMS